MRKSKKIGPRIGPSIDTFSIIFLLKRKKKNKRKMIPIYARVTISGERIELSTKRNILLKNWDKKRQRPKLTTKALKTLNYYLEHIRNKFYVEHQKLLQKSDFYCPRSLSCRCKRERVSRSLRFRLAWCFLVPCGLLFNDSRLFHRFVRGMI